MLNRPQDFKEEFNFFLSKLKNRENFNLLRFSDGELFMLQEKKIKLGNTLIKIGNRIKGIKKFPKYDHKIFNPKKQQEFVQKLKDSFTYRSPEYYVGINCKCCVGEENFEWQFDHYLGADHDNLTWSNILLNANYPFFRQEFYPLIQKRGANVICNINADLSLLTWVKKDFRIGDNAFSNLKPIETIKAYIEQNKIEDEIFLFSASAFSNVAQYELAKTFPNNTYIDIGTTLSEDFKIPSSREYIVDFKNKDFNKLKYCQWN